MRWARARRMLLRCALLALPVTVSAIGAVPALASGGGGCGRPLNDRTGVKVAIKDFCFGPTVLRLAAGTTITWTNRDPFAHTVLGANGLWGSFQELGAGQSVAYRFNRTGVFPYACTIHPGMVGAVVVGHAPALGMEPTVTAPVIPVASIPPSAGLALARRNIPAVTGAVAAGESVVGSPESVGKVIVLTELAVLLGLGGMMWRRRRLATGGRRATSAA